MKLRNIVGINLKYYRYKSGLSQEKFYLGLELNPKYLAKVERGKAKKLKVHINDLILYNENHVIDKKRIDEKQKVNN